MTSITLPHANTSRTADHIAAAWRDLTLALRQLISSFVATVRRSTTPKALTVHEEAENLRSIAHRLAASDPRFAQDLYAAADRHELGVNAG